VFFCNIEESIDHLFMHCSLASCIWNWIVNYNSFIFYGIIIEDLWHINAYIPFKDDNICEMVRGVVFMGFMERKK
jgi:hypothetical protein